jgi:predicted kinase
MAAKINIMRGVPGSGKSTKAKTLTKPEFICSADDWHIENDGVYRYKAHEAPKAHAACLKKAIALLNGARGVADLVHIVIDNTNLRRWEYEPYVQLAEIAGAEVEFHEFVPPRDRTLGDYVRNCASRNIHGGSPNQVLRMASIFEVRT